MMGWLRSLSSKLQGTNLNTSLACVCRYLVRWSRRFFLSLMHEFSGKWLCTRTFWLICMTFNVLRSERFILDTCYTSQTATNFFNQALKVSESMLLDGECWIVRVPSYLLSLDITLILLKLSAFITIVFYLSYSVWDLSLLWSRFLRKPLRQNCVHIKLAIAGISTTRHPFLFLIKLLSSYELFPSSTYTLKQLIFGDIWISMRCSKHKAWLRSTSVKRILLLEFSSCKKDYFSMLLPRLTRNDLSVLLYLILFFLDSVLWIQLINSPLYRISNFACYSGMSSFRVSRQRMRRFNLAFLYKLREFRLQMVKWLRMGLSSFLYLVFSCRPFGPIITPWS